ncbi:hypothetical protein AsAng_0043430 [Aureispira anguillae]|uniref:Uncharacterized protein n=1 Tax=Aureispira anguillae TaxID=2864201 RepID=A0A915YI48_9BACT|nr:hypothetical protein AsAng_0043430 [Aureispira anguillae]
MFKKLKTPFQFLDESNQQILYLMDMFLGISLTKVRQLNFF